MKTKSEKKKMNTMHVLTPKQMFKITGGGDHGFPGEGDIDWIKK